ncbi:MAG: prepilin-type N-terminal cleavage/methylation domain-containing protein [Phycisphaerae bacterium]|nr:prepilin-type N-terminal cleavage/methylation domain-containing protein [Phycisphaerae bacterium]
MRRKGFTLVELMVVVLIVAVLAAVVIPMLQTRVDAAKWTEGRAGIGTINTAIKAWWAEHQDDFTSASLTLPDLADLMTEQDLAGKWFTYDCYTLSGTADERGYIAEIECADPLSVSLSGEGLDLTPTRYTLAVNTTTRPAATVTWSSTR